MNHGGAIKDVVMCLDKYSKENHLDPTKRLCDVGVTTAGSYTILYDHAPVSYPLLTTPLHDHR
jgi:hypothetical protein